MGTRRNNWHVLALIATAISAAYALIIPDPIGKDTLIELLPEIQINAEAEPAQSWRSLGKGSLAFAGDRFVGYYSSSQEKIVAFGRREEYPVIEDGFAIAREGKGYRYLGFGDQVSIPLGEGGVPLSLGGVPFVIRDDQMAVAKLGGEGGVAWRYEFGRIVTGASVASSLSAWGTLSGEAILLDGKGLPRYVINPSAFGLYAKYPCVYGIALSPDGSTLALLHGLEPQRLTIFQERGSGWAMASTTEIENESPYPRAAVFSGNGLYGLFDSGDGLLHYDARENQFIRIILGGQPAFAPLAVVPVGLEGFGLLGDFSGTSKFGLVKKGVLRAFFPMKGAPGWIKSRGEQVDIADDSAIRRFYIHGGDE